MHLEYYRASMSIVTSNTTFFEFLKVSNIFDSNAEKCQQPDVGKRLETYYEGSPLLEIAEVVKKFHEASKRFVAAGGKKRTKKEGYLYEGRLNIREAEPFPGTFISDTKSIKGFPGIVPEMIYLHGIGSIEYHEHFTEDRGGGYSYRGFRLRLNPYLIENDEKGTYKLFTSPKIIGRVIRYFRQSWG